MNYLDRIKQLTDENALLRSQLADAQAQAKRDSETIARLAKDKERMDWLCSDTMEANSFLVFDVPRHSPDCLRSVIDAEIRSTRHA